MNKIKNTIKKTFPYIYKIYVKRINKKIMLNEYKMFENNYINSSNNVNNIGYKIIILTHSLEKAMTSNNPRYFGIEKVQNIIKYLNIYEAKDYKKDYAYNIVISVLNSYCEFYEKKHWEKRAEYNIVKLFLNNKNCSLKSGSYELRREDIEKQYCIDYESFLKSRHAIRSFDKKSIKPEIVKKAAMISQLTPTACNRQMVKIYYISDVKRKNKLLNYLHGLTNFEIEYSNYIIVTYDMSALDEKEFTQGMFNAGLVSMNFVNSLHSMGIGSCFLEFNNSLEDEAKIKTILNIPSNEKIAITIVIGYYPKKLLIPCSTRKNVDEIYKEVNGE